LAGNIAIRSALLENFHGDPDDRIIIATSIFLTATLYTADKKTLSWDQRLLRFDASK
jgi:PIN domain nuclease of toxin-antitoxin system